MTQKSNEEIEDDDKEKEELFDKSVIDDEHVCALIDYLTIDELEQAIRNRTVTQTSEDADNLLELIVETTQNTVLIDKIDTITSHTVTDRETVLAAGKQVEEILECHPFDLKVTDPDNDFQDPMVSINIDDAYLTGNAELNSELISYACRIRAETGQGQQRLFEKWCDAVSEGTIRGFKQSQSDPEALNFVIPDEIPATGDVDGHTPITEIPYIGDVTAKEIHPTDSIMSIEDYIELSPRQHSVIELPLAEFDCYKEEKGSFYEMLNGFLEKLPSGVNIPEIIGHAMGWIDKTGVEDSNMHWINDKKLIGVTESNEVLLPDQNDSMTVPNEKCTQVHNIEEKILKIERGTEKVVIELRGDANDSVFVDPKLWRVFSTIADYSNNNIYFNANGEAPVFTKFNTEQLLVVAPQS